MGKSVEHETYVRRKYLLFLFQRIIPLQSDLQNQICIFQHLDYPNVNDLTLYNLPEHKTEIIFNVDDSLSDKNFAENHTVIGN